MTIDRSGRWWTGTVAADLDEYLVAFTADGHPVGRVVHAVCVCGAERFGLRVDDDEGCAERTCLSCGRSALMLDSGDTVEDAALEAAACSCGGESFEVAVGFALREDGEEVRWVSVGLRCTEDGVLGVCTDWSVDYSPSGHLLERV